MRYSKLVGKTQKKAPQEAEATSHKLLIRDGFIDRALCAGVYSLLPLGLLVHRKIEDIIRQEMNAIGGQEVFLPTLQPKELWQETDRWDHMDPPLFKLKDRHGRELALGSTHEEVITDIVRKQVQSYKDLPLYLYQIQNKFRNEMRSSGGLLRVREFVMKDLYSFHTSEADLADYFEKVVEAYFKIYKRCGLSPLKSEASGGTIGGTKTYEFQIPAAAGEDKVLVCQKCGWATNLEVATIKAQEKCPQCPKGILKEISAIEVGHIFSLGTKYSESMGAYFTDRNGRKKPIVMGCYGIGVGRLMAAIVEVHHDKRGIIWPKTVAPYQIQLLAISRQPSVTTKAEEIYKDLTKEGIEVLYDNRQEATAGEKFADADLIGCPVRIVVSEKTIRQQAVEVKSRTANRGKLIKVDDLIPELQNPS